MSSCQCQKVKHTDYGGGSQKKINWHNEVHTYWHQFWCQIWRSPKLFKNTFYLHFEAFWSPSYVTSKLTSLSVADPGFPRGGGAKPRRGRVPTYYLANFSQKLHENEEILGQRGDAHPSRPPLDPPLTMCEPRYVNLFFCEPPS